MAASAQVVAALLWRGDRFLACQRPEHKARGLLWEFVGGKVEPGESREAALRRECREELDIEIGVDGLFMELTHDYPDLRVHLYVYRAHILRGEPRLLEHADLRWLTPEEALSYPFCPADAPLLAALQERASAVSRA